MNYILNYKLTTHFESRLNQRQIDPFLVSICLVKGGVMRRKKRNKIEYILNKEGLTEAVKQGYISVRDYLGITTLTVVAREKILITVYASFGDTGLAN